MNRFVYEHILQNVMLPFARVPPRLHYSFQQDNDPKHTSNHIIVSEMSQTISIFFFNWFATNRVIVMESPSQSPDLNLIEHLWEELEKRVSGIRARNADEKFTYVSCRLRGLRFHIQLIQLMPRRCQAVIDSRGFATKY
uniref:Tc1-like transposase DDE domain-containing protein n=1 Tax=Caenorhabditis japonica TaxID=281687 RepID=A0A8R1IEU2_CAEJA